MTFQTYLHRTPCYRCGAKKHSPRMCTTDDRVLFNNPGENHPLAWPRLPSEAIRLEWELKWVDERMVRGKYPGGQTTEDFQQHIHEGASTSAAGVNLHTTPAEQVQGGGSSTAPVVYAAHATPANPGGDSSSTVAHSANAPPTTVAGPSTMPPVSSELAGTPVAGSSQRQGSTASSTLVSTPSGPVELPVRPKPAGTTAAEGSQGSGSAASSAHVSTPAGPSGNQPGKEHRTLKRRISLDLRSPDNAQEPEVKIDRFDYVDKRLDFTGLLQQQQSARKDEKFPLRLGFGTNDSPDKIHTNHFRITLPTRSLYRYTIGLTPTCSSWSQAVRKRLIQTFFEDVKYFHEQAPNFATDYLLNIVSWRELEFPSLDPNLNTETERGIRPSLNNESLVFSKKVPFGKNQELVAIYRQGSIDLNSLKDYVEGKSECQDSQNSIACQSLSIIISKAAMSTDRTQFETFQLGNNRLFFKSRWEPLDMTLNDRGSNNLKTSKNFIVCHHGFSFTVKPAMGDVLLNINNATSAFFHPCLVSDFIEHHKDRPGFQRLLLGVRVYVDYRGGQSHTNDKDSINRIKTINGIGCRLDEQTFKKDGETVSVYDHLVGQYPHQQIKRGSLCVNLGGKSDAKALWYAPEMLRILPYQPYRAKLTPEQTSNMIGKACKKPDFKVRQILGRGLCSIGMGSKNGNLPSSDVFSRSSLQIDRQMLTVPSRCAPEPLLSIRSKTTTAVTRGSWNLRKGENLLSTEKEIKGGFHYLFIQPTNQQSIEEIHNQFVGVLRQVGIRAASGRINFSASFVPRVEVDHIGRGLDDALKKSAFLVILLLPRQSTPAYSVFKDQADKRGLQSLCFGKYISQYSCQAQWKSQGYFRNIGMKVNLKLGNVNYSVKNGFGTVAGAVVNWKTVMVLGADVTHPSAMSSRGTPSIAAVVGSVDELFGRFPGSMRWQQPDERSDGTMKQSKEIIEDMKSMVKERLREFFNKQNSLPRSIVYYRDGVSEAQRSEVKDMEVTAIRAAHQEMAIEKKQGNAKVFITAIIVTKRHGTRFFPRQDGVKHIDNIVPGTVVDSGVTSPSYFDFFLASHAGIQGTSKPAHYFVVANEMGFHATELQNFTQNICAIYVRATMTVSYASPAYYADRLCERGRIYLRDFYDGSIPANLTRQQFLDRLNGVWNKHRNPWNEKLNGTMFWM